MLPNDNVSMSVVHLDHVLIVYRTARWSKIIETLSLGNILQLCKVRSFHIIDYTNRMKVFNTIRQ